MKWINVKDRLPEDKNEVLVYIPKCPKKGCMVSHTEGITQDIFESGKWYYTNNVTHWMPLPKEPKE